MALMVRRLGACFTRFRANSSGVSALEFALLAPLLLLLVFGVNELCQAMMVSRKVTHTASAIGDLAAQSTTLKKADIDNIFAAGSAIVVPFSATPLTMRLTGVTLDSNRVAKVAWSRALGMSALTAAPSDLPQALLVNPGDSLVVAEASYNYTSQLGSGDFGFAPFVNRVFSEKSYLLPRNLTVSCSDCSK